MSVKDLIPAPLKRAYRGAGPAWRGLLRRLGRDEALCSVRGLEIRLGVGSEIEHYRASTYADKEPETLDWLDSRLRSGDVLFDVGANVGLYSIYAAKRQAGCRVYAFEPAAPNIERLCRNVEANGLSNVVPCTFALSNETGFSLLHLSSLEKGAALHALNGEHDLVPACGPALRQGVFAVTLDEAVARFGLPRPTLLKLDVDGIEEKIAAGGAALLASPSLRSVLIECLRADGASSSPLEDRLRQAGFAQSAESAWTVCKQGKTLRNRIYDRR